MKNITSKTLIQFATSITTMLLITMSANSFACLNDLTVLADGSWKYAGASTSGDGYQVVSISTDSLTQKRYITLDGYFNDDGTPFTRQLTQCSKSIHSDVYTLSTNLRTYDKSKDIFELFSITLEVDTRGYVVANPHNDCLFSLVKYYQYSKKGMSQKNESRSACFRPGYHVGFPRYDNYGQLIMNWHDLQPVPYYNN